MLNADFSERTYTAEVIKCNKDGNEAFKAILALTKGQKDEAQSAESDGAIIKLCHAFLPSQRAYHRSNKTIISGDGKEITIPRRTTIRDKEWNLYDVFVAQCRNHIVVAVPFHELAEEFYLQVDRRLGGMNTSYEKLDITAMVVKLGVLGTAKVEIPGVSGQMGLSVTRCHLAYADQESRTSNLHQIRMTGANLGGAKEYKTLIAPVLEPGSSKLTVTPVVLGFGLSTDGVRKSSATTDRHGNFKLWVAPGLRRLIRLFDLLHVLEIMKDVTMTTSNVPILQSKAIRDAED